MNRKDIVLLSTADWDNPFWTNKQHMAVELVNRGHRVFYVDSLGLRRPSASTQDLARIVRRLRKAASQAREVHSGLWVWSPATLPFQGSQAVRSINRTALSQMLALQLRRLGFKRELLWTYNPMTTDLLGTDAFETIVYHCVDDISSQPGMPAEALVQAEERLVRRADIVFTTSPRLSETRGGWNNNTHFLPNVADFQHFSKALNDSLPVPDDLACLPGPRIGFHGALSGYKVDFPLIRTVAERHPEWSIVLIGKVGEGDPWTDPDALSGFSNLHVLGPRPYETLPAYLKGFDAVMLPNVLNDYTASMFPMKFFEYLAAGKPVVSVDLPAIRGFSHVSTLCRSTDEFVAALETAVAGGGPALETRLQEAREHTYQARTDRMIELLGSAVREEAA